MPHLPWQRLVEAQQRQQQLGHDWRGLTARLLALIYTVSELTLPVLSKAQVSAQLCLHAGGRAE